MKRPADIDHYSSLSAMRHNHNIYNGRAEIVRLVDYLVGRESGQYMVSNTESRSRTKDNAIQQIH